MQKPLQINPHKLSQPMGAHLAFLGVKNCMPLMHGAQGCASFSKVFFTRHFNDPIAIQTTAVNDITAVLDGGHYGILTAISNITQKVKPELIGLHTTGLTETKGDDIRGACDLIKEDQPIVWVNTPDFEGGLESGFAKAIGAMIDQLTLTQETINPSKIVLLPNVNIKPIEIEKIKEMLFGFGCEVLALPDLSESLDGHLGAKQGSLSSGGISLMEIQNLGNCGVVISVGESVRSCGAKLQEKNKKMQHWHFDGLSGLIDCDVFIAKILEYRNISTPSLSVVRWRKRLQDALLDTHFAIGSTRFALALEPDQLYSVSTLLSEAGGQISIAISPTKSAILEKIQAVEVVVGDLDDLRGYENDYDVLVTNFHGMKIANKNHKGLILRGFPNYEEIGNQLKNDSLYEGSSYFLFEVANTINHHKEANHE